MIREPTKKKEASVTGCIRCGTCCKKGGPAFHLEDKPLIESGTILAKHLFTIRKGEPAYDNLKGCLLPSATDIIKIKSQKGARTCIFYDEESSRCKIYHKRPVECKALKCWDTREIEAIYDRNRLTRQDLMGEINGLWDLIEDHQERCAYETVLTLVDEIKVSKTDPLLEKKALYIIQYDLQIRSSVIKKGNVDSHMIDFLFGRTIFDTLKSLGMNIRRKNGKHLFTTTLPPDPQPT